MGGNSDRIYKHSANENWASEVSRLGAWDQNRPHRACTYHIPRNSSRLGLFAVYKENECCQSISVCVNNDAKKELCKVKINYMSKCELCVYS
jgi:hypothetical protein